MYFLPHPGGRGAKPPGKNFIQEERAQDTATPLILGPSTSGVFPHGSHPWVTAHLY